jgi:hypothetical protein
MRLFWGISMVALSIASTIMADGFDERFKSFDAHHWSIANDTFKHPHFDTDWALQFGYSQGQVIQGPSRHLITAGQTAVDAPLMFEIGATAFV